MNQKVGSIRDVARETGLSVATVSRVVNGADNVTEKTRELVLEASQRLNYIPNPAARALATNRSRTIAAIIPNIEHSVFAKYVAAIEQTLDEHGYSLVMAISNNNKQIELNAGRKLLGMGADAFILSGSDHNKDLITMLSHRNIPFAFTSVFDANSEHPTIGYNNELLARNAVQYLVECGHQNIAIVHGPLEDSDRTRARKTGALNATENRNLKFFETSSTAEGGKTATKALLRSPTSFTAILCFSDILAQGAYFALQEAGLKIPKDMSVMGFDNLDWSAQIIPPLTTINLPARRMGQAVASQLIEHLEGRCEIGSTVLNGELVIRKSVSSNIR